MSTLARIRQVIERVPRGRVITYGQAAEAAGFPRAARLTVRALYGGTALPWHRVVAAGGRIALKGADGEEQRLRLSLEGVKFKAGRVRMDLHGWVPRARRSRRSQAGTAHRKDGTPDLAE